MKYVQSLICFGLFGWLFYAVAAGGLPDGDGGSSKTRALASVITSATDEFGTLQTAAGLALVGVLLGLFFLMRRSDA